MKELLKRKWKSTRIDTPPLEGKELHDLLNLLDHDWKIEDEKKLKKEYKFPNFKRALEYTNKIGEMAEEKNHHPDIHLSWGKVKLVIWTHRIGGLAEMDFVWAANAEEIYQEGFAQILPEES